MIEKIGKITITENDVLIENFSFKNASMFKAKNEAVVWAIKKLVKVIYREKGEFPVKHSTFK